MRGTLLPQLYPEGARGTGEHSVRVVQRRAGPVLAPVLAERPGQDRVALARPYRAAQPGGEAGEHHRRSLAEVRDRSARRAVERAPDELGPDPSVAIRGRGVRRPAGAEQPLAPGKRGGEDAEPVLARRPADD